jgi:1-acyl-sn-glycerol-3-phosphate acyltransferase
MPSSWQPVAVVACLLLLPALVIARRGARAEIHGTLSLLWWVNRFYCGLVHRLQLRNEARLPGTGPALLIANHTCGVDNFLLQAGCRRVLAFLITQEWYDHWLCGFFCRLLGCIPVKRDGRDTAAIREALRAIDRGRVVTLFPEGRITPASGEVFGEGRPGAAYLALRSRVPVYPAYIRGTPPTRDIWAAVRGFSNARVAFGPPIDLSRWPGPGAESDRQALDEVTQLMMDSIRNLRGQLSDDAVEHGP